MQQYLLLNSFQVGLHFSEIKRLSGHPLIDVQDILTRSLKVGSGIIRCGNKGLCAQQVHLDGKIKIISTYF